MVKSVRSQRMTMARHNDDNIVLVRVKFKLQRILAEAVAIRQHNINRYLHNYQFEKLYYIIPIYR